ncbi:MAG TPA: peptidase, partial [Verrucomicrobiae bacterium]
QFIAVPKGNRFGVLLSAKRNGAPGDLALSIDGLPTGVRMESPVMSGKQDAMPFVFYADADAPIAGKLLDLVAASEKGVKGHFRQDVEFVYGQNQTVFYGARVDKMMVAVTEAAPFKVRIVEPKVPLVQAGTMNLKVVAERAPGFDEPIALKMLWNPPGISSAADVTIPKGQSVASYTLNSTAGAEPHTWKIAVTAAANYKGGPLFVSSQLAPLEVSGPYVAGTIERTNAEPGTVVKLICRLEQKQPFEGKATVKLLGLPEKITAADATITKDSKQVVFDLKLDPTISPGSHRALFCSVEIKKGNEVIHQNIASGGVLRIVPPKKAATPTKVAAATATKVK